MPGLAPAWTIPGLTARGFAVAAVAVETMKIVDSLGE